MQITNVLTTNGFYWHGSIAKPFKKVHTRKRDASLTLMAAKTSNRNESKWWAVNRIMCQRCWKKRFGTRLEAWGGAWVCEYAHVQGRSHGTYDSVITHAANECMIYFNHNCGMNGCIPRKALSQNTLSTKHDYTYTGRWKYFLYMCKFRMPM